ncbi:hypothetical protein [Acinetobacter sp. YH12231]|uniref:hypothetical protein n=1 Tax=Acinetobacter sp. YH12231 TaxID=2601160 RepID=UPI0015D36068|nr:hypothetical protein [Acinetobacter sp. YH12231]
MKSKLLVFITLFSCSITKADLIDKYTKVLEDGAYSPSLITTKTDVEIDPEIKNNNCSALSKFAESSFKARQSGVSAEKMFSVISDDEPSAKKVMQLIIVDSFKHPIMYSGKELSTVASEYANHFYIDCMV